MTHLLQVYRDCGRSLRIFIDLSACPRFLSIGLMSQAILLGVAHKVTLFYAEGDYPEEKSEADEHELFTVGTWDALPIPGLEGSWDPDKKQYYMVSVGFEGSKTLRLLSRDVPDKVAILFPDPGVKPEYVQRTMLRNKSLIQRFHVPDDRIIRSNAGDAIEAWMRLNLSPEEKPREHNVYYVCCGTKSHSVALALRALVLRYPALLYIVPDHHKVVDVAELGIYWRFDLKDMSSVGIPRRFD